MVSIHAPARGATKVVITIKIVIVFQSTHPHGVRLRDRGIQSRSELFQSTHPHGVRHQLNIHDYDKECFNPRTRTGCDLALPRTEVESQNVSIHAPARGATYEVQKYLYIESCFNPRTRTGCDRIFITETLIVRCFNPRTRTGCDGFHEQTLLISRSFNPRTRTGCDKPTPCDEHI